MEGASRVGILSKHPDPRLRSCDAYDTVYRRLVAISEARPTDDQMLPPAAAPASPLPAEQGKRIWPACGQDMRDAQ